PAPTWPRRREPGRARVGPRLRAAALEGESGDRQPVAAGAALARDGRFKSGRAQARDRLPAERLTAARDRRPAERARGRRRAGTRVAQDGARCRGRFAEARRSETLGRRAALADGGPERASA